MDDLSKECFAYPLKKMYPVHTKQAALNSYKLFFKDVDNYSQLRILLISNNFIKAAQLHDITYDAPLQPVSETHSYTTEDGTNVTISKVASGDDVKQLVTKFNENRNQFSLSFLRKAASTAYIEADLMLIDIPEMKKLACYAGFGIGDPLLMAAQFGKRAGLLPNLPLQIKSQFYRTYKLLNQDACTDETLLYKKASLICDIMDNIDKMYKLLNYYGTEIEAPLDVCFKQTVDDMIKEASDYLRVDSTDTILSKQALLDNKDKVNAFLKDKYLYLIKDDELMFQKIASLSKTGIKALVQELE